MIEDYDKVCKEYEEAQKFIVENIQNKENTLKEIQSEFDKVNYQLYISMRRRQEFCRINQMSRKTTR